MDKKYLTMKERICFTLGAFGRSGIYTLMSMFTLVFFQNGAGLTLGQGTTIILIGRIFDAINDPMMGMIVDRTKSRWGKMRPYLLFSPVPIAITTILLFTAPFEDGSTAAFVWALVTYILWGVAFTVQDVPFWGLSSVITRLSFHNSVIRIVIPLSAQSFLSSLIFFCNIYHVLYIRITNTCGSKSLHKLNLLLQIHPLLFSLLSLHALFHCYF